MINGLLLLLINVAFFALEVSGAGFFPKPLSQKEKKEALERMKYGDLEARNKLIEHNLRLIAHIVKKISFRREKAGRSHINRHNRNDKSGRYLQAG